MGFFSDPDMSNATSATHACDSARKPMSNIAVFWIG